MSNSEANKCNYPVCGCSPEPDGIGGFKVFCPHEPEYEWANTTNIGITPQEKITHTKNQTPTPMDEITNLLNDSQLHEGQICVGYTTKGIHIFNKEQLMSLIELVEEAQIKECQKELQWDEGRLFDAKRVSQQLTENQY